MDSLWATVLIALAGGVGGFSGAGISAGLTRKTSTEAHRRDQQRRDAETTGPISDLLFETGPLYRAVNVSQDPEARHATSRDLRDRVNRVGGQLEVMAAGHPDAGIRQAVTDLAKAIRIAANHSEVATESWMEPLIPGPDRVALRTEAKAKHDEAEALFTDVKVRIATYGSGGPSRSRWHRWPWTTD